jgi:hypothetical protein
MYVMVLNIDGSATGMEERTATRMRGIISAHGTDDCKA